MKKFIVTLTIALLSLCTAHAQEQKDSTSVGGGPVITLPLSTDYYELYPTENMWTFLKLETSTGRIWKVQYSTKGASYRFQALLSDTDMCSNIPADEKVAGRFELHKTQNMYNFIMLDKFDGRCWQVQWTVEGDNDGVIRIW